MIQNITFEKQQTYSTFPTEVESCKVKNSEQMLNGGSCLKSTERNGSIHLIHDVVEKKLTTQ